MDQFKQEGETENEVESAEQDHPVENPQVSQKVGYKNPPPANRFRKGRSGNPKGRPKGSKNFKTIFREVMSKKVTVQENGRQRVITRFEAAATQLANKGAAGDQKALAAIPTWVRTFQEIEEVIAADPLATDKDEAVKKRLLKRLQRMQQAKPSQAEPESLDEEASNDDTER